MFCSPLKAPLSTRIILRNTIWRNRMFYLLLFTQTVQISIVFLSVKLIIIKPKTRQTSARQSNIIDITTLLLIQNVQISIVFLSVKSIIMKIKEWHHVSLTSNISGKTWSNCTCRGCFENIRTSRFQICPWFWKLTKICGK